MRLIAITFLAVRSSVLSAILLASSPAGAAELSADLVTVLTSDTVANGIALSPDHRVFLPLSRIDGSRGPQVVEWRDGRVAPFPDAGWNDWTPEADPTKAFVRVNALRIGPDGALWIVDVGAPDSATRRCRTARRS